MCARVPNCGGIGRITESCCRLRTDYQPICPIVVAHCDSGGEAATEHGVDVARQSSSFGHVSLQTANGSGALAPHHGGKLILKDLDQKFADDWIVLSRQYRSHGFHRIFALVTYRLDQPAKLCIRSDRPPDLARWKGNLAVRSAMVALYLAPVESSLFHSRTGVFRTGFQQADHSMRHGRHTGWHWHKLPQSICVFSEFGQSRKHNPDTRPLVSSHPGKRNAVGFAGREFDTGDQQLDAAGLIQSIPGNFRVHECRHIMARQPDRGCQWIGKIRFIVNVDDTCWHRGVPKLLCHHDRDENRLYPRKNRVHTILEPAAGGEPCFSPSFITDNRSHRECRRCFLRHTGFDTLPLTFGQRA
jgi:hypothetical protein